MDTGAQQIQFLLFEIFWNFFSIIFYPKLAESVDVEPMDMEGWLYVNFCKGLRARSSQNKKRNA